MPTRPFRMLRCAIAGVEAIAADSRHSFVRHTHTQFGIGVIRRGAQRSHSGRGQVEAGPGDVITVNPGEVHDGAPIGDGGRAWRILYLDPALLADAADDIAAGTVAGTREFPRPVLRDPTVATRVSALFDTLTRGSPDAPGHGEERLLAVLAGALRERRPTDADPAVPAAIRRARARIDDDPAAPVTLAELARDCGLSRFQVLRGFARATGLTPHAYLVQRRIDLARRLIGSGIALAEVAAAGGFADQSHMTRIFVRRYGITPGAYAAALA